ncbi:MAG: ATP-binding cassette domain-containing protein [SAR202 cluster bacterium]|nr:ATP-binding cassette domain-containing protein [SAR202 cluster bacterium]
MKNPASDSGKPLDAVGVTVEVEAARLLDSVSMGVGRGELVGLIGPNGAGKTTLIKAMSGLMRRQGGAVALEGRDMDGMSPKEIAQALAMVPQAAPYTFGFTALEVVVMGRYPHMSRFQVEGEADRRIAMEAMAKTEVEGFADRQVTTLSGGERQRVMVARALAQGPRVLLLDEPTANLDIQYQIQVMELVRGLTDRGLAAVAAMHDLTLAARYCHRLILMSKGRVLAEGTPWDVLTPENIERAFAVKALVYTDPVTDTLAVRVLSQASDKGGKTGTPQRVHVIAGGGKGSRVMYLLKDAGFDVTAGVLGEGDTDFHAAQMLSIPCVKQPSFASISPALHQEHLELIRQAQCVVVADICIGENNFLNLEAAGAAGRLVLVEELCFESRDFTGGKAASLYADLRRRGLVSRAEKVVEGVRLALSQSRS